MEKRKKLLHAWLKENLSATLEQMVALPGDASFRRYWRLHTAEGSYMLMDAPPGHETCMSSEPFVAIAHYFQQLGAHTPTIFASDIKCGFILLEDFGDQLFSQAVNAQNADLLYSQAMETLLKLQCERENKMRLPLYSAELLQKEMALFEQWFIKVHHQTSLTAAEKKSLSHQFKLLTETALLQPQVCVHRDYHCRNLMILANGQLGVLDFQDAVWGPVTYDLVSLLRDNYLEWPEEKVEKWLVYFYQQLLGHELISPKISLDEFRRWFDWMGLQRHLKCIGLFPRLYHRDQKDNYLQYMPLVMKNAQRVCGRYGEFTELGKLLTRWNF